MNRFYRFFIFTIMFLILFVFTQGLNYASASEIRGIPSRRGVNVNKKWTIRFNKTINSSSVNTDNIYIVDENNQKIDVYVKIGQDKKSIIIVPIKSYSYGRNYFIVIKDGIKSSDGHQLIKETKMQFRVIRPFPNNIENAKNIDDKLTICIDPGQLWANSIKGNTGVKASYINLNVALKLGNILKKKGVNVIYTRKTSKVGWSIKEDANNRARISNEAKADLFLTINCNAYENGNVNGIETYYLDGYDEDKNLADYIQKSLIKYTFANDRGIKSIQNERANILRNIRSTKVRLELGFITNSREEKLLENDAYQQKLANAIAEALEKYVGKGNVSDYLNPNKPNKPAKIYKVCINPSRGGFDSGIIGVTGTKEKDINLDVALKVGKILESKGVNVIYTRKSDYVAWNSYNEIQERVKIANNAKADLMVSIGCNSFNKENSNGIETFYLAGKGEGKEFAQYIENDLIQKTGAKYRGVKGVSYLNTLKLSNAVSVWAAIGFLTNHYEEAMLKKSEYRDRCAEAIADGVIKYIAANPNGPTIKEEESQESKVHFDDIVKHVKKGQTYYLPGKVNVTLGDGTKKSVNVTWNTNSNRVNTNKSGIYEFEGKIEESKKLVNLTLIINKSGSSKFKVCIDPGHGGYDPGAIGQLGTMEKNITLPIGLKVGNYLVKNGINVVYTRTTDNVSWPSDENADLRARCNIANNADVDLYVSIHANKYYKETAHGIETYHNRYSSSGKKVADNIQKELLKETGAFSRGTKGAGYYVLKYVNAISVLTEVGFLSNPIEERKLLTNSYRTKCARAIARGILESLGINNYVLD